MPQASAKSKKVRDVSKAGWGGGSPEERPYDVSRGQNQYVIPPLAITYFNNLTALSASNK